MGTKNDRPSQTEPWEWDTYRTGSTQPPKSHGGLIAFLLGLTIFFCGVATALGLMNITFAPAAQESPLSVSFSRGGVTSAPTPSGLGVQGQAVDTFWQYFSDLPQGIYITRVFGQAEKLGISVGDILLSVNDVSVPSWELLQQVLSAQSAGSNICLQIYRDGRLQEFTFTLQKEE